MGRDFQLILHGAAALSKLGTTQQVEVEIYHGTPLLRGVERGVGALKALVNLVIFGIILLVSLLILNFVGIQPWLKSQQVMQWKEIPCEILESSVKPLGKRFSFEVLYEYELDRIQRRSRQFGIAEFTSDNAKVIQELVNQYPAGSQQVCYVNGADVSESVIHRQWNWSVAELFWPLLFASVGAIGCGYSIRSGWKSVAGSNASHFAPRLDIDDPSKNLSQESSSTNSNFQFQTERPAPSLTRAITIPPLRSSMTVIVGYLMVECGLFALILWNIVVAIPDFRQGKISWGQLLGCAVLSYFAFRIGKDLSVALLKKVNPTTDLTIRPAVLQQGQTAEISWGFQGNTQGVVELVFRLVGIHATLEAGETQSKVIQTECLNEVIFQANEQNQIKSGSFQFTVPEIDRGAGEMITGDVNWRIAIEGTQARWPVNILLIYPIEIQ